MVEFYFSSTFLNGFEVSRCLQRDQMKKDCNKVVRELVLFCILQRAGVVIKTNFNIKKKKKLIAFMKVSATKQSSVSL